MKKRIKSMMPNGITGLERVNTDPQLCQAEKHLGSETSVLAKICSLITQRMAVILGTRGPSIKAYVHRDRKGSNPTQINGGSSLTNFLGQPICPIFKG
jgi:hypothetical protein